VPCIAEFTRVHVELDAVLFPSEVRRPLGLRLGRVAGLRASIGAPVGAANTQGSMVRSSCPPALGHQPIVAPGCMRSGMDGDLVTGRLAIDE
jgi:hypothetical protein